MNSCRGIVPARKDYLCAINKPGRIMLRSGHPGQHPDCHPPATHESLCINPRRAAKPVTYQPTGKPGLPMEKTYARRFLYKQAN